jgi:hypothetical protein
LQALGIEDRYVEQLYGRINEGVGAASRFDALFSREPVAAPLENAFAFEARTCGLPAAPWVKFGCSAA